MSCGWQFPLGFARVGWRSNSWTDVAVLAKNRQYGWVLNEKMCVQVSVLANQLKYVPELSAWRLCNSVDCELKVILFYMVDTYTIFWLSPVGFGTISTEVWHLLDTFQTIAVTLDIAILHHSHFLSSDHLNRPWQLCLTTVLRCSRSLVLSLVLSLIAKNLENRTLIFSVLVWHLTGTASAMNGDPFQIDSCFRTQSFMNRDITHSVIHELQSNTC